MKALKTVCTVIAVALMAAGILHASTNEITVNALLRIQKDAIQLERNSKSLLFQMEGSKYNIQTITATTTNQNLTKGSVGNCGWAYMRCLSTNEGAKVYTSYDNGTTTSHVCEAREPALFRLAPDAVVSNFTVKADSGTVDFEFTVIED